MNSGFVDDFTVPWAPDPTGLWTATAEASASHLGQDGTGMRIIACAGSPAGPVPSVHRVFQPALDLREVAELRLWTRGDRAATGCPDRPYYLVLEAAADVDDRSSRWSRYIRLAQANRWELQRFFLEDMPAALRGAVGVLRLRGTSRTNAFEACVDDLCAWRSQVVRDVEAALVARLHGRIFVEDNGTTTAVPAIMNVPGSPAVDGLPHILVSPWAVLPLAADGGEECDNDTEAGVYVRPRPQQVRLDYRIDVRAGEWGQRGQILEWILSEFGSVPRLVVGNEPLPLVPFEPSATATGASRPGVTPLYYRVVAPFEVGRRVFRPRATPFVVTAHRHGDAAEVTPV
ncbi:hypothetical protein LX15_003515 [Streptoalloteichus tenebrarius]|uniref:DUF4255 domain-containing protein n=1 Tax=Streptoalloteichus tenebrarius (strain ATCC 17920 / DSM 40477 / JCM 4838 / CBS 697.72 / NBRC 16177 / NCIMB 11028 / NRRL B-12390 / A12253. 1 / ISP 5477) TaxID=1933 RepID=A0ABT1HWC6_STRSD|nr:hypothetical protein [Streptoalloteichus tenebrarius]MCP2259806.1 hypothetical protein [Streptoalloteichus tenebrarius]BFE99248.1 hypothetical protein GCM10020241_09240 [Streptoalloteichus tenebrarius]